MAVCAYAANPGQRIEGYCALIIAINIVLSGRCHNRREGKRKRQTAKEIKKDNDKLKGRTSEMREENPAQAFKENRPLEIGGKWE